MGFDYLGEWTQWNTAGNPRENESSAARDADDTESQIHPRNPLESLWNARRGLRVGCADQERAYRTVQLEEAT
jgi:hypothetical protein